MSEKLIIKKINRAVDYARNHSPYYKRLFKKMHFTREITRLSQFESIPITSRDELAKKNDEFIAVSKNMWADVAATSGTSGKPIYIPFTKTDIARNAYFIAKKFSIFGLRKEDIAYITTPIDQSMWIAGLSVWSGCVRIGACSLRAGNIGIEKHMEFIEKFRPTVIFGLPSFILKLGEEVERRRYGRIPKPRLIVTFGENVMNKDFSRNVLGKAIEKVWGARLISGYCSTEASPGFECALQSGHHVLSEMLYVEIVDPETSKVLGPQKEGLVVVTHFGREGLPLIRYANGDLSFLETRRCGCARTAPRLGPVLARIDGMVKIKGVNIYPSQLENFLLGEPIIRDFRIELFKAENSCDNIKIAVKFNERLSCEDKENKLSRIQAKAKDIFGIKFKIQEARADIKEKSAGIKEPRIIDRRKRV